VEPEGKEPEIARAGVLVEEDPIHTPEAIVTVPATGVDPPHPAAVRRDRKSTLFAFEETVTFTTCAAETTRPPDKDAVPTAPVTESVAATVSGKVPEEAGVPESTPVDPFKDNPEGSVPDERDHDNPCPEGYVDAAKVCE